MNKQKKAFTLVELIVVITILAILWTIAFISLQWYSKDTRNSVRLSDLLNIDKTLWIKLVTAWKVPVPYNKIDITASGTIFIYQWNAWERVLDSLWVSNWWKDPKDETYYTYATNVSLNKYQIIWFMEWDAIASNSLIDNSYAVTDLTDRSIITKWDELWILLDATTNVPLVNWVDVANTTTSYKAVFEEDILIEGTGWVLFSNYYNRDKVLLIDKELAKLDDSLVWYWDMETTTLSWATTVMKDFSQYGNDWECYNSWTLVNCWDISWPRFENSSSKNYMNFYSDLTWNLNQIISYDSNSLDIDTNEFTITWWYRLDRELSQMNSLYPILLIKRPWHVWWFAAHFGSAWYLNIQYCHAAWCPSTNFFENDYLLNSGEWYFYTWIKTQDSLNIYNNGVLMSTEVQLDSMWSSSWDPLKIWSNFEWDIDELRIYNRALSIEEINSLYELNK